MGEIADMMLDGTTCQGCGEFLRDGSDGPGYPGYCAGCARDEREAVQQQKIEGKKLADKIAGKIVKEIEKHFGASFEPDILPLFNQQMGGIIRHLYLNGNMKVCHKGLLATAINNRKQTARATERAQRKERKANAV